MEDAKTITLYVPCDVVSYRLRVGHGESLSLLEQALIRAVHAIGLDQVAAGEDPHVRLRNLSDLLRIGERVTLDLVHDLWRKRYLQVDFRSSSILLAANVRRHIEHDTLDELGSAEVAERTADLMVDRLTGRVLPMRGAKAPVVPRLAVEPEPDDTTIDQVSPVELTAALLRSINSEQARERDDSELAERPPERIGPRLLHIHSRYRIPPEARGEERRWLPLDVAVTNDLDLDRVQVTVVDRRLTPHQRRLAEDRLTTIVADFPTGNFSRALRAQAESRIDASDPFDDILDELRSQLSALTAVPPNERRDVHKELGQAVRRIESSLRELAAGQADITVVPEHEVSQRIREVCAKARRQLVLLAPRLTMSTWAQFAGLARDAMSREAQVVVLWGDAPGAVLDGQVRNLLTGLRADFPGVSLVRPLSSCRIRTWGVIADDQDALLGGRDRLEGPGVAATRVSASVMATSAGVRIPPTPEESRPPGSETIRSLLRWAASTVPDGQTSRMVFSSGSDFSRGWSQEASQPYTLIQLPEAPSDVEGDVGQFAVHSWAAAWTAIFAELESARSRITKPVPRLVEDLRHADHLWQAIRRARHRLVIGSDHLDRGVVDDYFLNALSGRLAAGLSVTLAFPNRPDGGDTARPKERLAELARQFAGHLRIVPAAGRFLICDDDVLLSSFDQLRDGIRGAGKGRHRRPAQVGLFVRNAALASRLCDLVGAPVAIPAAETDSVTPEAQVDFESAMARQRIINSRGRGDDVAAVVERELAKAGDPWELLAVLDGAVDYGTVEIAVACCLLHHADRASAETRQRYYRRLIEGRWLTGDYPVAAALRRCDPDLTSRPRMAIANAAAAQGTDSAEGALEQALRAADLDHAEQVTLLAVACAHFVRWTGQRAETILRRLAQATEGPWRDLADILLEWQMWSPGRPLAETARQLRTVRVRAGELTAAWDALDRGILLAHQPPKHLDGSVKTVFALYRSGAVLGKLSEACDRRDIDAVIQVVADELAPPRDPAALAREWLDRTWDTVTQGKSKRLDGDPRASYLGRLIGIIESARHLAEAAQPSDIDPADPSVVQMRGFSDRVRVLLPALRREAEASGRLESDLTARLAARLAADLQLNGDDADDRPVQSVPLSSPAAGDGFNLTAVLRESTVRWRFPELAVELGRDDEPAPELVKSCILLQIAAPLTEPAACRLLIDRQEFELAEQLIAKAPLSRHDAQQLISALRAGQRSLRTEVEERLKAVQQRREQLRANWPEATPSRVAELVAQLDEGPVTASVLSQVKILEETTAEAETSLVAELSYRLAEMRERRAMVSDAWAVIVANCIKEGEYDVARNLLDHPGVIPDGGPATLLPLSEWRDSSDVEAVLDAVLAPDSAGLRGEGLSLAVSHLRPALYDEDSWAVIRALRTLAISTPDDRELAISTPDDRELDAADMREFVAALHQFIGVADVPFEAEARGRGMRSTLYLAPDGRLPLLQIFGECRLTLWVAASDVPPPIDVRRPVVWLVPDIRPRPGPVGPGVAVLGADDVLLIASSQTVGTPLKPTDRQMQLLRRIGPTLGPTYLLGPGRGIDLARVPSPDHCLAWVFDLLGSTLDQVTRSALLYEAGGRPDDLRVIIDALIERRDQVNTGGRGTGRQPVTLADLHHVRRDPATRAKRLDRVMSALERDALAKAVLLALVYMDPLKINSHVLLEVAEGIAYVLGVEPDTADIRELLTARELEGAATRLQRAGLVKQGKAPEDSIELAGAALRDLLASVDDLDGVVSEAMAEARRRHAEQQARSLLPIRDLVIDTIDHHNANLRRDIDELLDAIVQTDDHDEMARFKDRVTRLRSMELSVADVQARADRDPEPCLLRELISAQFRRLTIAATGGRDEHTVSGGEGVLASVNDWVFGQALYYLLDNARLAITAKGTRHGYIEVTITAEESGGPTEAGWCVIEIEDSGIGMDPDIVARLRRGERFTTRNGKGMGFQVAASWFRYYRGDLEIVAGNSVGGLGGAHLRGRLPLVSPVDRQT